MLARKKVCMKKAAHPCVFFTLVLQPSQDQEHQEPIDAPAELALADETGHSPEPEKMGDKVDNF